MIIYSSMLNFLVLTDRDEHILVDHILGQPSLFLTNLFDQIYFDLQLQSETLHFSSCLFNNPPPQKPFKVLANVSYYLSLTFQLGQGEEL